MPDTYNPPELTRRQPTPEQVQEMVECLREWRHWYGDNKATDDEWHLERVKLLTRTQAILDSLRPDFELLRDLDKTLDPHVRAAFRRSLTPEARAELDVKGNGCDC